MLYGYHLAFYIYVRKDNRNIKGDAICDFICREITRIFEYQFQFILQLYINSILLPHAFNVAKYADSQIFKDFYLK